MVGVSNNFQFRSMPGFEDDLCFDNLEQRVRNDSSFTFISIDSGFEYLNNIQTHHNRKRGITCRDFFSDVQFKINTFTFNDSAIYVHVIVV